MSIHKVRDEVYKIRWREGGREPGLTVHGSKDLAKKILRKKMSARMRIGIWISGRRSTFGCLC